MAWTYHNIIQTGGVAWVWVSSVVAWDGIVVNSTDATNPIVSLDPAILSSSVTFYSTTTASNIGGYSKIVTSIESADYDEPAVNVSTGAITGSDQLVWQLATDTWLFVGNPWIITITTIWEIRKVSWSDNAQFYFKVFHRDSIGTETEIAVSNLTAQITGSTYSQFNTSALLNNGAFDVTDRVVIKYYASRVWWGSNPTYEFSFGGNNPVRTLFPLPTEILLTNYYTKTEIDSKEQIKGIAEVDFGTITQESDVARVTVTDASISATSYPIVAPYAITTTDHDPDDYSVEWISATIANVIAGVSFEIVAVAPNLTFGKYKFVYHY